MAQQTFTLTRTIDAAPAEVFAVLTDLQQARQWMPSILSIKEVDDKPMGPGKSWIEVRKPAGSKRTFVSTLRVVEHDSRMGTLVLGVDSKQMAMVIRFQLEAADEGTQVHYEAKGGMKGILSLLSGKVFKMMREQDADLLERLDEQVLKSRVLRKDIPAMPARGSPKRGAQRNGGAVSVSVRATTKKAGKAKASGKNPVAKAR